MTEPADASGPLEPPGPGSGERTVGPPGSQPSLLSPLLSGRSLQPLEKQTIKSRLRRRRGVSVGVALVVLAVLAVVAAKFLAEDAANRATSRQVSELRELLTGATPRDFLAFNSGVKRKGSLAERIRDRPGFVNVIAVADASTIRFQPSGWWSGFTERCIVVVVTDSGTTISVPKTACVRVNVKGP